MDNIPNEILMKISEYIDNDDLFSFITTCHKHINLKIPYFTEYTPKKKPKYINYCNKYDTCYNPDSLDTNTRLYSKVTLDNKISLESNKKYVINNLIINKLNQIVFLNNIIVKNLTLSSIQNIATKLYINNIGTIEINKCNNIKINMPKVINLSFVDSNNIIISNPPLLEKLFLTKSSITFENELCAKNIDLCISTENSELKNKIIGNFKTVNVPEYSLYLKNKYPAELYFINTIFEHITIDKFEYKNIVFSANDRSDISKFISDYSNKNIVIICDNNISYSINNFKGKKLTISVLSQNANIFISNTRLNKLKIKGYLMESIILNNCTLDKFTLKINAHQLDIPNTKITIMSWFSTIEMIAINNTNINRIFGCNYIANTPKINNSKIGTIIFNCLRYVNISKVIIILPCDILKLVYICNEISDIPSYKFYYDYNTEPSGGINMKRIGSRWIIKLSNNPILLTHRLTAIKNTDEIDYSYLFYPDIL